MSEFDPTTHPHRRFNPLTNEYILVSPHRTKRPWLGHTEPPQSVDIPEYDATCYLCPRNTRTSGQHNPDYTETYVFENDFAAVLPPPLPEVTPPAHPLMTAEPVHGACDVVLFHPKHNLTMSRMSVGEIERVIEEWVRIYEKRGSEPGIRYVQIFENKGSIMGCSNPHPHGQVWSISAVPSIPAQELRSLKQYAFNHLPSDATPHGAGGRACLLCDYVQEETKARKDTGRVVVSNDHWLALVPWWATWPFEVLLLPYRRHVTSISDLTDAEKSAFADILSRMTKRYDNLFSCSFAYSMGIHQRPVPAQKGYDDDGDFAHLHLHFDPPLLRSATVRKFLVGYEMMAEAQRDLTPEQAADRLRKCDEVHYLDALQTQA